MDDHSTILELAERALSAVWILSGLGALLQTLIRAFLGV